ncbi:MAG: hypothetical protein SNJ29_10610 [Rikenellaceae bacterium]
MKRELLEDLRNYFAQKEVRTHDEEMFLSEIKGQLSYFPITFLHRDDLSSRGFDAEEVDDCTMKEIAEKMGSAYQDNGYWIDLDIIAEDRVEKFKCPKCWGDAGEYYEGRCHCGSCNHEWQITESTGRYVLVEHSESPFFEKHEVGFECYNSDDNGARYIPEHIYIAHFDNRPKAKQTFRPIGWPESQSYLEWEHTNPAKFARCEYINPADTVLDLGSNALFVPQLLIKK